MASINLDFPGAGTGGRTPDLLITNQRNISFKLFQLTS
jgi:hypothetical protein